MNQKSLRSLIDVRRYNFFWGLCCFGVSVTQDVTSDPAVEIVVESPANERRVTL